VASCQILTNLPRLLGKSNTIKKKRGNNSMSEKSKQEISNFLYYREFVHNTPDRIAMDLGISINDLRIYMIIRSFMDTTGDAYASNEWIAKKLNITERSVSRCITRLCKKNYISREDINGHRHLKIVINSMRTDVMDEVTPVSGGVDTGVQGGGHWCPPIRSKIITSKIINNNNIVDSSNTTSVDNFDKSKQTKGKVDDDYKNNPLFAKFYLSYPNKQKPKEAYKAFLKLNPDKEFVEMLLKDIDKRIAKDVRWKTNQYTPHPATYLKSDYWMGDIITEAKPKPRYPNKEERAENEKKIREREERAIQLKKEESADAKRIFGKMGVNYDLSYD
jgi:hypothetical protein